MAAVYPCSRLIPRLALLIAVQGFKKKVSEACIMPRVYLTSPRTRQTSIIHLFAPLRTVMP